MLGSVKVPCRRDHDPTTETLSHKIREVSCRDVCHSRYFCTVPWGLSNVAVDIVDINDSLRRSKKKTGMPSWKDQSAQLLPAVDDVSPAQPAILLLLSDIGSLPVCIGESAGV